MPNTLPLLLTQDDGRLERLHRAVNRNRLPAERKRSHKPVPFVVSAQVTTTDRQPPARQVENQMPQPRLHIEHLGSDRVAQRMLQLVDLTVAFATHVDLKSVARRADAQVGADGVEALF
jgi:ribosome assembly protein YihI (activator of Der GTPase)